MTRRIMTDNKEDTIGNNADNIPLISPKKDTMAKTNVHTQKTYKTNL